MAILVGAAAGAYMVSGATGSPSPAAAVPDVAAVVYAHGEGVMAPMPIPMAFSAHGWTSSWSEPEHAAAVDAVRSHIADGTVYQVNMVGHQRSRWSGSAQAAADAVAAVEGAHWAGSIAGTDWAVASGSPECFLTVEDGHIATYPIKGTAPATARGRQQLAVSVKERAEHVMIVDLQRNDISRVARPGTVSVPQLFAIRSWAHLWQAESTVRAQLEFGFGLADVLRAMCPPGSVTGTPKATALETIADLEPVGRGPSMGALGFLTGQRLALGLTIRTIALEPDWVHLWAGGGITWRSDPDAEVREAHAKALGVRNTLGG
ncbi:chorismate-binding protein [Natronoglycomyces albus]|uniref:Chorismate-binding protein n=2 Tax=Natronoglycomyces albus TaxID=2811108 RepID=A0A895XMD7_9ACTN|nr:chorismate-binding protein [Natronoglycomyces albus]QSB06831.1 chorismate-binding protein [Natronoglycomyces albus]